MKPRNRLSSLKRTYKELKLYPLTSTYIFKPRLKRTYKELKLFIFF